MAEFQYVGSGVTPPEKIVFMGEYEFTLKHKFVEVDDPRVVEKLRNNPSFKEREKKAKKAVKTEAPAETPKKRVRRKK